VSSVVKGIAHAKAQSSPRIKEVFVTQINFAFFASLREEMPL
jgi:hypothetical protein